MIIKWKSIKLFKDMRLPTNVYMVGVHRYFPIGEGRLLFSSGDVTTAKRCEKFQRFGVSQSEIYVK